jgi:hypothetical protein
MAEGECAKPAPEQGFAYFHNTYDKTQIVIFELCTRVGVRARWTLAHVSLFLYFIHSLCDEKHARFSFVHPFHPAYFRLNAVMIRRVHYAERLAARKKSGMKYSPCIVSSGVSVRALQGVKKPNLRVLCCEIRFEYPPSPSARGSFSFGKLQTI